RNECPRMRTQPAQTLRREVLQRFAHGRARGAMARREGIFVELRPRAELARDDVSLDGLPNAVSQPLRGCLPDRFGPVARDAIQGAHLLRSTRAPLTRRDCMRHYPIRIQRCEWTFN